jgi:transglutaminase-like putative cysteine protease
VEGVDLFQSAYRTWEFGGGDCDDHSILAATLLSLNGVPAKFRVTASKKGQDFSHIYTMAGIPKMNPKKWIAVDTTLPGDRFGYEVPFAKHKDYPA